MAIFRPGPLATAISGTIGGVNFVHAKAGPVIRQRIRRTKNLSLSSLTNRSAMHQVRALWRSLAENQRSAWRKAASDFPFTNRLGLTSNLTGFALFTKLNLFAHRNTTAPGIAFIRDVPKLNRAEPWIITAFSITSGGAKSVSLERVSPGLGEPAFAYGARTFSTAPRLSWYDFRAIDRLILPGLTTLFDWDTVIGDPIQDEQCWIKIWVGRQGRVPFGPLIASTFAL